MRLQHKIGLMVLIILLATSTSVLAQKTDSETREFATTPGKTIEFDSRFGGSVYVQGWDRDEVQVTWSDEHNDLDIFEVTFREKRHGLVIEVDMTERGVQRNSLTFEARVPHRYNVEIDSGGGIIVLEDLEGDFQGRSGGGGMILRNLKGDAHLTTGGGVIEVIDCELDGKVSTGGGGAVVRNLVGNLRASSGGGIVSYENVRDKDGDLRTPMRHSVDEATKDSVLYKTAGGSINVEEAPAGAVLNTGGGNIEVEDANLFVVASTGGGDIEIEIEDGWVKANTGAGDVEIEIMEGFGESAKGVEVTTGHGDVTLILPRGNLSMELDLDLSYTRNSSRDFEIETDLDIDLEHTRNWDSSMGSPRKHILGTGNIGGGRHLIKIRAVNGDIEIIRR